MTGWVSQIATVFVALAPLVVCSSGMVKIMVAPGLNAGF